MNITEKNLFILPALFAAIILLGTASAVAQNPTVAKFISTKAADTGNSEEVTSNRPANNGTSGTTSRIGVQTTDPIAISLNEAIRRALQNNNDIEIARDDVRFQETQIRSQLGFYDQVFNFTPNLSRSSTTGSRPTKDITLNSSMAQAIQATGGNYTAFFNNTRTENVFAQAQVSSGSLGSSGGTSAIYSSSLGIRYTQPLARNMRIDNTRRNLRIARRRLEQTDADFRRQATEIIAQVQRAYWDLVFALRDQQNRVANLDLTKENLRQVEARIEAGAAAPLARAEVATELANREGDLLLATQQVSIAENALKRLVLKESLSVEWQQSFVPTEKPAIDPVPVSLDDAIKDAMDNRHELRRLKLAADINAIDIKYFKNQTKPQVDFNSSFRLDGFSQSGQSSVPFTTNFFTAQTDLALLAALNDTRAAVGGLQPITNPELIIPPQPGFRLGGFSQSLSNMFRNDAPNFSFGLTFSFPFKNRTAEANLAGAVVQENQIAAQVRAQEQVIIVEVRNAVQAVETTRQRVLTARRARENAEIQLDGERKLFDSGKSTTFLLFQRENALTNARNAEIRAETDYSKAISDLQRVTSTTFQINNIEVDSPQDDH